MLPKWRWSLRGDIVMYKPIMLLSWGCLEFKHFVAIDDIYSSFVHMKAKLEAWNITSGSVHPDVW